MVENIENQINEESFNSLLENILNDDNIDLIEKDINELYQITTSKNQNNKEYNNGETTINLGECENKLKEENTLNNNANLIIYKMDYYINNLLIPITEYEIYNPITKEKLDLSICNKEKITINIPVTINENELYKYNPDSDYYNDRCYPSTEDCGDENILEERKNNFNNNFLQLCEKDFTYKEYDLSTHKVKCECSIKINFSKLSEIINNKNSLLYHIDSNLVISSVRNIECLFKRRENQECKDNIKLEELIENKYIPLETPNSIDKVFDLFSSQSKNLKLTKDEIIEGENVIFHMTTTEKQYYNLKNNLYTNISLDLGECENILQNKYKINQSLAILKVDIERNDTISKQVEYQVYDPITLQKFNLSYCVNIKIDIYPPINIDDGAYNLAKLLKDQGYDIY